ncbi:DUF4922 domain-containing protein [Salinisphaera sp. SPP-AMP-43]|uniref:DUF4922 domain-containing protein n=1 Tax=Salinisphaera sp. SPP-AMP-43 TaxID=3121288 RepID=UPI003C6DF0EA
MNWKAATRQAHTQALAAHALAPIDTDIRLIEDAGLTYLVRLVHGLKQKPRSAFQGSSKDPFAPPYDPDLWVGELAPAHAGLLNKFPVLDPHLLLVTTDDKPQTHLLGQQDCQALLRVLHDWDGLAFYNGGPEAGASQPHKHLQVVDLPLANTGPALPVADALARDLPASGIGRSMALPFPHAATRLSPEIWATPAKGAALLHARYHELLEAVGLASAGPEQAGAYNLLATREWLWLVPRQQAAYRGIEINALGFAGALLVTDAEHLERLESIGPARCLREACPTG